jgi:hypothetical protein
MTAAERQRRRRARLAKEHKTHIAKRLRFKQREETALNYAPVPPGITYWTAVTVQTAEGPKSLFAPTTRPLAACSADLEDEDVLALLGQLTDLARERGLV